MARGAGPRRFDELDPAAVAAAAAAAPPADADNFGMPEDGYNYGQHLRQMGGGTFIERQRAAGGGRPPAARSPACR